MRFSRRALLAGAAVVPLAPAWRQESPGRAVAAGPRVIGVSPENSVGWVDAVSREPLPGPRWPLPGWSALAVSTDQRAVLLRYYASNPFLLATTDTQRFDQSTPFQEGVSSVKGAVLAWPDKHRLLVAHDTAYGHARGLTRIEIVDPTSGHVAARREIAAHLAGAASGRRGLVLALSPNRPVGAAPRLALVDWTAHLRTLPLAGFQVDNIPDGQEPSASVALSPDEQIARIGSSQALIAINLATGRQHAFRAPRDTVSQLAWLDARHALLTTQRNSDPTRLALLDTLSGTRRTVGETTSIPASGPGRLAFTPPEGGITTIAANTTRLSHHAGTTPLSMLYPQTGSPYVMAVPGAVELRAGRRITIDLRTGALALDKTYNHPPSDAVPRTATH
jgi:hypothetical protein